MVFCAADTHGRQDIAFPHQSEVKVNGGEIKANLRGLKNKPGSTRPVDITKELRLNVPNYVNNVELTYALTSKVDGRPSHVSCLRPQVPYAFTLPFLMPLGAAFRKPSC
jgi:E3 SUMO-protein ligase PIAS1